MSEQGESLGSVEIKQLIYSLRGRETLAAREKHLGMWARGWNVSAAALRELVRSCTGEDPLSDEFRTE